MPKLKLRIAAAALIAAGIAQPVLAQERPPTRPTRDVDVTYKMTAPTPEAAGRDLRQRMRWMVTSQKLRVDPPSDGVYMLIDYRTRRMALVREADRQIIDLAAPPSLTEGPGGTGGARFVRQAQDQVAGLACTQWQTVDSAGRPTLACITADGVLLRAQVGGKTLLEAISVTYGPIDPAAFIAPASFAHVAPQAAPPATAPAR